MSQCPDLARKEHASILLFNYLAVFVRVNYLAATALSVIFSVRRLHDWLLHSGSVVSWSSVASGSVSDCGFQPMPGSCPVVRSRVCAAGAFATVEDGVVVVETGVEVVVVGVADLRRRNISSPLADVRGPAGRTRAIAVAIRAGLDRNENLDRIEERIHAAEHAGPPFTLW